MTTATSTTSVAERSVLDPADVWPASDVPILRSRVIRPGTPAEQLSRFGDPVWVLQPAHPDAHQTVAAVRWATFPVDLVLPFKTVCLALLDHPIPADRAVRGGTGPLAVLTISQHVHHLRALAEWMAAQDLTRLCEVTDQHLDVYRTHVRALTCVMKRKRDLLNTVVLIHSYRDRLPAPCRLATHAPWNGAQGDNLVALPPMPKGNRTPRIAPDTMEALLAWSLRMLEHIGPDIVAARRIDQQIRAGTHPSQTELVGLPIAQRLAMFLATADRDDTPLPGKRDRGQVVLDEYRLCQLLGLGHSYRRLSSARQRRMVAESGLTLVEGCPLATPITGTIDGRPWRDRPITPQELPDLVRILTAALFVIVCYLSGLRPGEALNLRRGCRDVDPDTGELLLLGRRGKGRGRTPLVGADLADDKLARRWVVVEPVHDAIALLEQLAPHAWVFPPHYGRHQVRSAETYTRTAKDIALDIGAFVGWVNRTFTSLDGGVPIPADPTKRLHGSRFRRTLAFFIVRRPRGLIAAALQYGHVATKVTLSYAGDADTGWLDDLAIERLEMVLDQISQDRALLDEGEHVSGPSAGEYRARVERAAGFAGRVVTSVRNVERLLAQADPNVHHGQGMTCVWTKETAACRIAKLAMGLPDLDVPDDAECRSTCVNLAYTDRDVQQLADRLAVLEAHADDPLAPQPLRDRAVAQAAAVRAVIDRSRDRDAERTAIRSAADRMLVGTPLRSTSGKLTATELITESGLRRDVVYDHPDLVEEFQARVKAQNSTPVAFQQLAEQNTALATELAATKRRLAGEQATTAILRMALAELSLELHQAQEQLADLSGITRLPISRQNDSATDLR
jgi:integrase